MINQETLTKVIEYLNRNVDSEAEEEIRWALKWVLSGKVVPDATPSIIISALEEVGVK